MGNESMTMKRTSVHTLKGRIKCIRISTFHFKLFVVSICQICSTNQLIWYLWNVKIWFIPRQPYVTQSTLQYLLLLHLCLIKLWTTSSTRVITYIDYLVKLVKDRYNLKKLCFIISFTNLTITSLYLIIVFIMRMGWVGWQCQIISHNFVFSLNLAVAISRMLGRFTTMMSCPKPQIIPRDNFQLSHSL